MQDSAKKCFIIKYGKLLSGFLLLCFNPTKSLSAQCEKLPLAEMLKKATVTSSLSMGKVTQTSHLLTPRM
jgi:hypothetical protein